jgi:hypothetical protein
MRRRSPCASYLIASLCILVFVASVSASAPSQYSYVEGIDTTSVDGKGLDGFAVGLTSISGATVVYGNSGYSYLNCAFDDVQKVPDSIISTNRYVDNVFLHCFIVCNSSNNTWAKVQITRQLPDNRFLYRYGKNSTPSSKMLVPYNYDRQRIYRPNNVSWSEVYGREVGGIWEDIQVVTLVWEPPLPCNKKVTGYIVYGAQQPVDTAKPIDLKQWKQLATTSGTVATFRAGPSYLNVVAIYPGDTTDFSKAFTRMNYPIGVIPYGPQRGENLNNPSTVSSMGHPAPMPWCAVNGRLVSKRGMSGPSRADLAPGAYLRPANISQGGGTRAITVISR